MSTSHEYYEINAFDLDSYLEGWGEKNLDFIGSVEDGFDSKVDVDGHILLTVRDADPDEYKEFTGISFFRERKGVLTSASIEDSTKNPEFIVITTQKVFKADSEEGKKILEISRTSHDEKIAHEKQKKMEALMAEKEALEAEIEELKNS